MKRKEVSTSSSDSESSQPEPKKINKPNPEDETVPLTLNQFKQEIKKPDNEIHALKHFNKHCRNNNENSRIFKDIIKPYIKISPECVEIFKCLHKRRPANELAVIFESLLYILVKTAKLKSSIGVGNAICSSVLQNHFTQLEYCLGNYDPKFCSIALRLLSAIVLHGKNFAKDAANKVNSNSDLFQNLSKFRHRTPKMDETVLDDVRTNFVHFVLSFLMVDDLKVLQIILESNK